jgi:Holliday junction DNA helicase RuvA
MVIERLQGMVVATGERTITLMAGGIGFGLQVADGARFACNTSMMVYVYTHWNAEKGQSFFGFMDELSRQLFILLLTCQKIGPALALTLLRQKEPAGIIQDIMTGNVGGLSSCQGIGTKKAELIVYELKDKVAGLAGLPAMHNSSVLQLQHMQDALLSLSYSKQETTRAITYVAGLYEGSSYPELNVLLRQALAFLSSAQ